MKKLMLNWILYLCAISLCLGLWDPSPSLSQKQPADSKTPPVKAKEQPKASSEKQPEMILETPEHDAGSVYEGAAVAHTFIVKNKGKAELLINQVKPGWGCSVASFDKAVPPGQEGKITLSVKTDNMSGKFNKSATIQSNDPKNPTMRIKLSGEIKQYIGVTPSSRLYLTGFEGEVITKSVNITNNEDTPLKITKVTSDIDEKVDYELKTLVNEKEYELTVKNAKDLQGISRGTITLTTTSEKKPTLEIKVSINLRDELVVSPTAIYFGNINLTPKEEKAPPLILTKYVTVSKEKGEAIKIKKVTSSSKFIQTKIETKEEGKRFTITVSLDKDKLKAGSAISENIEIHTTYKKKSVVKVEVKGNVL